MASSYRCARNQAGVAERCAHHALRTTDAEARYLSLPGPVAERVFLFSLEELFLLHDLLVSAALLVEVESILAQPSRQKPGSC